MAPTVSLSTQTVAFHGDQIATVKVNDDVYVALAPIIEVLGLARQSQQRKVMGDERMHHMMLPLQTAGGFQEMLCLPLTKLNGWLFSINPAKVKPEIHAKLVAYQEECFAALFQYWHTGTAQRPGAPAPAAEAPPHQITAESEVLINRNQLRSMAHEVHYQIERLCKYHHQDFVDAAFELAKEHFGILQIYFLRSDDRANFSKFLRTIHLSDILTHAQLSTPARKAV